MNRQIRQLAGGLFCYVLLFIALNYWQVGRREAQRQVRQHRAIRREFESPRTIVTIDGVTVAASVENPESSQFRYQRVYPTGELFGHITGYTRSPSLDGRPTLAERRADRWDARSRSVRCPTS